jgi:metallophosphoesterase (TIGR00282 family)
MRALLIGDVFGKPGRRAVARVLPGLRRELRLDLVVANGENIAGGRGMTDSTVAELREAGVDVITSGNHVWDQRQMLTYLPEADDVLRPLNYPPAAPGQGCWIRDEVLVINAMGRLFMRDIDCPFRAVDRALEEYGNKARVRIVDFHAEATSEKIAMAWYLDGRVSAVVGTHTHVPTADARILPGGTATVTDLGMAGPHHSVIGMDPGVAMKGFLTALPQNFTVADGALAQFNSVLIEVEEVTGRASSIERVDRLVELPIEQQSRG